MMMPFSRELIGQKAAILYVDLFSQTYPAPELHNTENAAW